MKSALIWACGISCALFIVFPISFSIDDSGLNSCQLAYSCEGGGCGGEEDPCPLMIWAPPKPWPWPIIDFGGFLFPFLNRPPTTYRGGTYKISAVTRFSNKYENGKWTRTTLVSPPTSTLDSLTLSGQTPESGLLIAFFRPVDFAQIDQAVESTAGYIPEEMADGIARDHLLSEITTPLMPGESLSIETTLNEDKTRDYRVTIASNNGSERILAQFSGPSATLRIGSEQELTLNSEQSSNGYFAGYYVQPVEPHLEEHSVETELIEHPAVEEPYEQPTAEEVHQQELLEFEPQPYAEYEPYAKANSSIASKLLTNLLALVGPADAHAETPGVSHVNMAGLKADEDGDSAEHADESVAEGMAEDAEDQGDLTTETETTHLPFDHTDSLENNAKKICEAVGASNYDTVIITAHSSGAMAAAKAMDMAANGEQPCACAFKGKQVSVVLLDPPTRGAFANGVVQVFTRVTILGFFWRTWPDFYAMMKWMKDWLEDHEPDEDDEEDDEEDDDDGKDDSQDDDGDDDESSEEASENAKKKIKAALKDALDRGREKDESEDAAGEDENNDDEEEEDDSSDEPDLKSDLGNVKIWLWRPENSDNHTPQPTPPEPAEPLANLDDLELPAERD